MKSCHILLVSAYTPLTRFADELANYFNLTTIHIGAIFREELSSNSPLAAEIKEYMDNGKVIPSELTNRLIESKLKEIDGDILIVAYPRTGEKFQMLSKLLNNLGFSINRVWQLKLADYAQFIECKKSSDDPYVKKYGVNDDSILAQVKLMEDTYKEVEPQLDDKNKVSVIEVEHTWQLTSEKLKELIISCA